MLFFKNNKNSLPQQVSENMKRIEALEAYVKQSYYTRYDYGDAILPTPWAVDLISTDIPLDTDIGSFNGFLISKDAKLFSIINIQYEYDQQGVPYKIVNANYVCDIKGDKGDRGSVGPAGPQGATGEQGPQGIQGIQGEAGPQGPKGEDGTSFQITGYADTPQDLPSSGSVGDAYAVGVSEPKDIYVWVTEPTSEWVNLGSMQGAQGPAGPQGPQGVQGPQGIQGETGATGPQGPQGIQGETGPQGLQGETGPAGPQGPQGVQGPQGPAGKDGVDITNITSPTNTRIMPHINSIDAEPIIPPVDIELFNPACLWIFEGDTYYDDTTNNIHLKYDGEYWVNNVWSTYSNTFITIDGSKVVWCNHYDSGNALMKAFYFASNGNLYVLMRIESEDLRWLQTSYTFDVSNISIDYNFKPKLVYDNGSYLTLIMAMDNGSFQGSNVYLLEDNLDFDTPEIAFETITLGSIATPNLNYVWQPFDDEYLFYSAGSTQYELDTSDGVTFNSTAVSWTGLPSFFGNDRIWFDHSETFFSRGTSQYNLTSASAHTWASATWTGSITSFNADSIGYFDAFGVLFDNGNTYIKDNFSWVEYTPKSPVNYSMGGFWSDGLNYHYDFESIGFPAMHKILLNDKWVDVIHDVNVLSPSYIWSYGDTIFNNFNAIYDRNQHKFVNADIIVNGGLTTLSIPNFWRLENRLFITSGNSYYEISVSLVSDTYTINYELSNMFDTYSYVPSNNTIYQIGNSLYSSVGNITYKLVYDTDLLRYTWIEIDTNINVSNTANVINTNDGVLYFTDNIVYRFINDNWEEYDYNVNILPTYSIVNLGLIYYGTGSGAFGSEPVLKRYLTKADLKYTK